MTESLFRKDAIDYRRNQLLGTISLRSGRGPKIVVAVFVLLGLLAVALLVWGEYTRRTRVDGKLVPDAGIVAVAVPVSGSIVELRVEEGQDVERGDILAVIAVPGDTLAAGATADELARAIRDKDGASVGRHAAARAQLDLQVQASQERLRSLEREAATVQATLVLRREQHRLAAETLARYESLRERQFVTELQYLQQNLLAIEHEVAVQDLEKEALALQRQLDEVHEAIAEAPSRLAVIGAEERIERAGHEQELLEVAARDRVLMRAPVAGTVSSLNTNPGQAARVGDVAMRLLPRGSKLEAHLLVPSQAIGQVRPGDEVFLRYRAFPFQKYGHHRGVVARISRSAYVDADGEAPAELQYRVIVTLPADSIQVGGRRERLLPDMALEADIMGETRKLWEWIVPSTPGADGDDAS